MLLCECVIFYFLCIRNSIEDSEAETLLSEAMAADKSKVWWEKKRRLHEMLTGNRETLPV